MEQGPKSQAPIGPAGLKTDYHARENGQRLEWLLSRFQSYFGVTNYLGAKFAADRNSISPVLARLRAAGLAYFDDTGAIKRFGDPSALGVAEVDRLVGGVADLTEDLGTLERVAVRDGHALGKVYLTPDSFDALSAWAWNLESRELTLAPASAVFAMDVNGS